MTLASKLCPLCRQHFAVDGKFCPFDGTALEPSSEAPRIDELKGSVIDQRYRVERLLGEGGMGTVYEVLHVSLGRRFALKALRRDLAFEAELCARFLQEARAAAHIAHANVVQITDFGTLPSGQAYFVMELLQGTSLRDLIRALGPIPPTQALDIIRQVAEALGAAHAAGIIHRDLKPDNIHVAPLPQDRWAVKVLDFGLAKVAGASKLTKKGIVFGTPHYMSPEQAAGDPLDHRVDIYSLGVVLYEMFAGRVPFEADSFMGVLTKHMYMQPIPPSQVLGSSTLGELEAVVLRCLEKDPEKRFADMGALLAELERIREVWASTGSRPVASVPPASPASWRTPKSTRTPVLEAVTQALTVEPAKKARTRASVVAIVLGLLALLGLWGWFGRSGSSVEVPQPSAGKPIPSGVPAGKAAPEVVGTVLTPPPPPPVTKGQEAAPAASSSGSRARPTSPESKGGKPFHKKAPFGAGELVDPWAR